MARLSRMCIGLLVAIVVSSGVSGQVSHASGVVHEHHHPASAVPAGPVQASRVIDFPVAGLNYSPADITILVGEDVEWIGPFTFHPLVSDDGLWVTQNTGDTFTFRFTTPGIYRYHCAIHGGPGGVGMSGVVRVVHISTHVFLPLLTNQDPRRDITPAGLPRSAR